MILAFFFIMTLAILIYIYIGRAKNGIELGHIFNPHGKFFFKIFNMMNIRIITIS
jgi:hypothetical protein